MMSRLSEPVRFTTIAAGVCLLISATHCAAAAPEIRVTRFVADSSIELAVGRSHALLQRGDAFGAWTVMEIVTRGAQFAVLEDFQNRDGDVLIVDSDGVRTTFSKTAESSVPDAGVYLGHSPQEIIASPTDLLATRILGGSADPQYDAIARLLPPIDRIRSNTFAFVGTPDTMDKVGFTYAGRTPNFDPTVYQAIDTTNQANVLHGLVGGYLPALRFVYPEDNGDWTEMLAFAPLRNNGNLRVQPVWYRVSRIENGRLKWSRHVDSYHAFPPRVADDPRLFYEDLLRLKTGWDDLLKDGMQIQLPDERVANMARFGLVHSIMTRVGDYPKYGAVDKDYGGAEHDGFPDTFTVETTAMIEWGLLARAAKYIDNYLGEFVRDDGSILYRGPETGQFGRMLTLLAQFVNAGGDPDLLLKWRRRIDAITNVLLSMRATSLTLAADDPAFGMLSGWSEADAALEKNPSRYSQPYFSNSTEAGRGFRDLGIVWEAMGRKRGDAGLTARGQQLLRESTALRTDIERSMSRSMLDENGTAVLPAIAGVTEPFHVAVRRDPLDPQFRSYRPYMEMLYSGSLSSQRVRQIVDYRASHHDTLLGLPTAYGLATGEVAGFLTYGHGYGLIQHDMIREALLLLYSDMAHNYTRGSWLAPETRRPLTAEDAAPYCTPAQLVATMLTRWLLVFEDPESPTLWLGKGIPRQWLEDGKTTSVTDVATKWGRVSYSLKSRIRNKSIDVQVTFPAAGLQAETRLRLRAPEAARMRAVRLNAKPWQAFNPVDETITLPAGTSGTVRLTVNY